MEFVQTPYLFICPYFRHENCSQESNNTYICSKSCLYMFINHVSKSRLHIVSEKSSFPGFSIFPPLYS